MPKKKAAPKSSAGKTARKVPKSKPRSKAKPAKRSKATKKRPAKKKPTDAELLKAAQALANPQPPPKPDILEEPVDYLPKHLEPPVDIPEDLPPTAVQMGQDDALSGIFLDADKYRGDALLLVQIINSKQWGPQQRTIELLRDRLEDCIRHLNIETVNGQRTLARITTAITKLADLDLKRSIAQAKTLEALYIAGDNASESAGQDWGLVVVETREQAQKVMKWEEHEELVESNGFSDDDDDDHTKWLKDGMVDMSPEAVAARERKAKREAEG